MLWVKNESRSYIRQDVVYIFKTRNSMCQRSDQTSISVITDGSAAPDFGKTGENSVGIQPTHLYGVEIGK